MVHPQAVAHQSNAAIGIVFDQVVNGRRKVLTRPRQHVGVEAT